MNTAEFINQRKEIMNTETESDTRSLRVIDEPNYTTTSAALILHGDAMERIFKFADTMAQGVVTVPKHLQGKPADCLAIVMQATQWGMNPFAVAQKTHVVNGALGYEAQLVNAVLQATGSIKGEFGYEYRGVGDALECRVGATPTGAASITWGEWLSLGSVKTKNSPLWATNPKQQLGYLQVKNWARAFKPAAILGVYTTDELEQYQAGTLTKKMGMAEVVETKEPEFYPQADFDNLLPKWRAAIDAGKATADAVIAKAGSKYPLTDKQKAAIRAATATDATPKVTYASIAEAMVKAADIDALNDAAALIGEVEFPQQRAELAALYDKRSNTLSSQEQPL